MSFGTFDAPEETAHTRRVPRRPLTTALAAIAASLSLIPMAGAGASFIVVRQQFLTRSVHLRATYYVPPPSDCPPVEPQRGSGHYLERLQAWNNARCDAYVTQNADIVLRVYHKGRLVYSADGQGFGGPSSSNRFSLRGYWDGYIYLWQVAPNGCADVGIYYWKVTLVDPYGRYGYTTSYPGSFPTHR